jgi:hypothetical protein
MDPVERTLRERLARLAEGVPILAADTASSGLDLDRRPIRLGISGWAGLTALLVIVVGISWLVLAPPDRDAPAIVPGVADHHLVWDSGTVRLEADSVRIETPHGTFRAIDVTPVPDPDSGSAPPGWSPSSEEPWDQRPGIGTVDFLVDSSPGDTERTLEVTWQEAGVEMRLNLYLAADDADWWVTEVRVYDGSAEGHWIGWGGLWGRAADGEADPSSEDGEQRLRELGVPADAEVVAASGSQGALTSVVYRDARGRLHSIRCQGAAEIEPSGGTLRTSTLAPAHLCPPPPVDLGLLRTPLGETWTGDLDLVAGSHESGAGPGGELHIEGLRLSAF